MGVCKLDPLKCTSICYGFCDFDISGIGENSLPFSAFNSMHTKKTVSPVSCGLAMAVGG